MASVAWFLILLAGVAAGRTENRIFGGERALIEDYPSLIQVEFYNLFSGLWSQSCGGSILTSRYILSAAHCFSGTLYQPAHRRIRAGTTDRGLGGVVAYVEREYNHPNYGLRGFDADISVVLLKTPLVYSPVIQQGVFIAKGYRIPDQVPVIHAGWGLTASGFSSPFLLEATVFTVNNGVCAERYQSLPDSNEVTENMICTGILDVGGRDACQGDFGGPVYFQNTIVGVISWGHGCNNATYPRVSTSVASYTDWIESIVS
ncbi:trypsin CFT-1-like [Battus philenor]|uniref:trypsin CFT-1-like n=1 Tax=Battus philenor TaxID=42288 RepID=UPI0035CF2B86